MSSRFAALIAVVGALLLMPLTTSAAWAQKRVALIIGNGAYQSVAKLPNPIKDATAIAEMFKKAGFEWVKIRQDLGNLEFKRALREFMDAATDADVAVVYYAGHGIQVRDMNYMIPVDAKLATEIDAEDEAVSLDRIVMALEPAKRLRLVILDACRDNPFARSMKRRVAMRAVTGGLAKMEPTLGETLIAYAAKAGSTAEDGDSENSPFAAALLKNLTVPGLDIRLAFGRVRDDVLKRTGNRQEPFVYGSLGGEAIALVPAPAQPKVEALNDVKGDYALVERIGTKKAWEVFLSSHKEGLYADLARAQLAKLTEAESQPAARAERATQLASVEPTTPPKPSEQPSEERRVWDRIRDSGDRAKLREFIAKYPTSPLAETAKNRLDSLDRAAQEREDKARAERETTQRRDEEAKRLKAEEAARKLAERDAAQRRDEEEKRLKAEEAARKLAEREAAKQREDEAKRLKTDEAARKLAEREAAQRRDEEEKRLKAEEAARKLAEREAAKQREDEARRTKAAEADRTQQNDACSRDDEKVALLKPSLGQGWAREDLKRLERQTTCDRVRSEVVALLAQPTTDIAKPSATPQQAAPQQAPPQQAPAPQQPAANTPDLIASAQSELRRLGCFAGQDDGKLGGATTEAIKRYLSQKGRASNDVKVTESLIADLKEQTARACPLTCSRNEHVEGDVCVANTKPEKQEPKATARQHDEDAKATREQARREQAKREQAKREREEARREELRREERRREAARPKPVREAARPKPERAAARPAPAPQPAARSQAAAPAPAPRHGGVGGIVGVGF
ncbi:MAG: caspase family protein [Xanthobacteraceae bacterium]